MRRARVLLVLLTVAAGAGVYFLVRSGGTREPLEIEIPLLHDRTATKFEWGEVPLRAAYRYWLRVRSTESKRVRLTARLDEPAPEGMEARLDGQTDLLPYQSGEMQLVLSVPDRLGPLSGSVTIESPDLPGWSRRYTFEGTVTKKPREGPAIHLEPAGGLDLGSLQPGETRPFDFVVESVGTANLNVSDIVPSDSDRVRLAGNAGAGVVVPGGELHVNGLLTAPRAGGEFRVSVLVASDAKNAPKKHFVLRGVVSPPYAATPPRLDWPSAVRAERPATEVVITAREGQAPFSIQRVLGADPFFELESDGGGEPAREKTVRLRLRADAPFGKAKFVVRFQLAPSGHDVEWPTEIEVRPTILPSIPVVHFLVRPGTPVRPIEVRLDHLLGKEFRVTGEVERPDFVTVQSSKPAGLAWRLIVQVKVDLPVGVHEGVILVPTDDPETPKVLIRVSADVRR